MWQFCVVATAPVEGGRGTRVSALLKAEGHRKLGVGALVGETSCAGWLQRLGAQNRYKETQQGNHVRDRQAGCRRRLSLAKAHSPLPPHT